MKCPFCEKNLNSKDCNHIYRCNKESDKNITRFLFISYNYPDLNTKEKVQKLYEDQLLSLPDLKKKIGISYKNMLFLLNYFEIKKRNISESANLISVEKYKKTCVKKYGVDNLSKLDVIKDKKKNTFIKHYGVDNIWKSKEYYEWLHDYMLNNYGKKSLPNRYGKMNEYYKTLTEQDKKDKMDIPRKVYLDHWYNLSDEEKYKLIQKRVKFTETKIENKVSETLDKLNIPHSKQYWINKKSYDIIITNTNILIEVNGDFWHANPIDYKENDILPHPFKSVTAKELWEKDLEKKKLAESKGYKIIYIWEKELKENKDNLLDLIINKITIVPNKLKK